MLGFIDGAIMTGDVQEMKKVVRKSSAAPEANLLMISAEAGATRKRSMRLASEICSTEASE